MSQHKTGQLTSAQIRAGRALLKWTAEDLAQRSALGVNTVRRAELAEKETSLTAANDLAVRRALEAAGVEFIDENGGGAGVRLAKVAAARSAEDTVALKRTVKTDPGKTAKTTEKKR
jgi:transcriptional regulator with XRE-family HTH domain